MEDDSIRQGLEEARKNSALFPQESLDKTRALLTRARLQKNRELEILALANMANHFADLNDWQKGLTYCNLTLRLALQDEDDHEILSSIYMTQAILQFRTLKLKACILSLQNAWEAQQRKQTTPSAEKATLLFYTAMYSVLCGHHSEGIETCDRAIDHYLAANKDYLGCMAYSAPALYRIWYAFDNQDSFTPEYLNEAQELLKEAALHPIQGSYDNGFFYYCALGETARFHKDYKAAEQHYTTILEGATNPTHTANYHSVAARSALCRNHLGDLDGTIERLYQLLDHIDTPATRMLLPQSLRMGMDVAESIDRMDLYAQLATTFKTSHDRLTKAKMEAKHQLRVLQLLTNNIYVS